MVPVWVMIICWAYTKLITKLPFLCMDVFKFLCDKLDFIVFLFTLEENLTNFRTLSRMANARESITHNSNFFDGPLQFEFSKFHCI